jgi:hypothetical protein
MPKAQKKKTLELTPKELKDLKGMVEYFFDTGEEEDFVDNSMNEDDAVEYANLDWQAEDYEKKRKAILDRATKNCNNHIFATAWKMWKVLNKV